MIVHFLSSRKSFRAHCFTYPLRVFARQIKQIGFKVTILYRSDHPELTDCDVLCIVSDHFGRKYLKENTASVLELLEQYRHEVETLIWCDTNAGTGKMFSDVFPLVDLYARKQLLKDRHLYKQPLYEYEYHLHYYYVHSGERLDAIGKKPSLPARVLQPNEIDKLALSWNTGLGDYNTFLNRGRAYRPYWPWARYRRKIRDAADVERPIHVYYRASTDYSLPAVTFIRQETRRQLAEMAAKYREYRIVYEGKVSLGQYLKEMSQALITPSPFGWGEICWRDFECLLCGSLLLKPNTDHLETWPNYFETDFTYVAYDWNFSDFQMKIAELLESPDKRRHIAQAGQDRYLASISRTGGEAFAEHFAALIYRATGA